MSGDKWLSGGGRGGCIWAVLLLVALVLGSAGNGRAQSKGLAYSFELTGEINAESKHLLDLALAQAKRKGARLVIMRLDTPGGSGKSMRAMIKAMTAARLPVVVYVEPDGARAGSAGVFLTVASDVAAMAPQTNIGSASAIFLGPNGPEDVPPSIYSKVINKAVSYVRKLAKGHGRNADLAERMVREATNVTARRARRERLVDVVAESEEALLERLDGFHVKGRKARVLHTAGLRIKRVDPLEEEGEALPKDSTLLFGLGLPGLVGIGLLAALIALLLARFLWSHRPRFLR